MILMDIDLLSRKVVELLPHGQETILAAGLLAAAAHILRASKNVNSAGSGNGPITTGLGLDETGLGHGTSWITPAPLNPMPNPGSLDIAAIAQAIAARMTPVSVPASPRSLAHEMAGPLPSLHTRRKPAPRSKPQPIPVVSPRAKCPDCGDEVATHHPRDKTIGSDPEGRAVFVLCSQKRVRCEPIEE